MDSVLEGQRRAHEEIERAERAAATVVLGGRPRLVGIIIHYIFY